MTPALKRILMGRRAVADVDTPPIAVDAMMDFHDNTADGTALSLANIAANVVGGGITTYISDDPLSTCTYSATGQALTKGFLVGGVLKKGSGSGMVCDCGTGNRIAGLKIDVRPPQLSMGFFFRTDIVPPSDTFSNYDTARVSVNTGNDIYLSIIDYASRNNSLNFETAGGTDVFGPVADVWYWVTIKLTANPVAPGGDALMSIYRASDRVLMGGPITRQGVACDEVRGFYFGRDNAATYPGKVTRFSTIVLDWTNAVFPLLPW